MVENKTNNRFIYKRTVIIWVSAGTYFLIGIFDAVLILVSRWLNFDVCEFNFIRASCIFQIFEDVLLGIEVSVSNNPVHSDCALICDAMSIKSFAFYKQSTGEYEGSVTYG